ncbi:LysR family transcriptional regulator [Nocardioides alkalitolerans]|uniref:LysR family transcriptional regulator n=1 Tax=Nocardioides alkalitolerans TaxID=281714 RepID=UPI0004076A8C|nr:LysR family transcriptional regulator [Nocardioides alkalitolerans]
MDLVETRELRYFVAVAEELHFGRAAERLEIAQPPLSRAIRQLERRLGVDLLRRDRRGTELTEAGEVLLREARTALDAVAAAVRRTRRAARPDRSLVLATKAGASHAVLQRLLDAWAADPRVPAVEVLLCEVGEQAELLRDGRADVALMHRPVDDLAGCDTEDLHTEPQVAIVPGTHPLAERERVTMADVRAVPDLPMARWPRLDGTYPEGPGPEIRTQSALAQLVALGRALLVIPASSRAWQWPEHVAVPVDDAPLITTVLAWPATSTSPEVAAVVRAAADLPGA